MDIICAWCHKGLGSDGVSDGVVTHAMCVSCRDFFLEPPRSRLLRRQVDAFATPVLVIDVDGVVTMANMEATVMLGGADDGAERTLVGRALGCPNAARFGGCGAATGCRECAFRRSVIFSRETGLPQENVVAYLVQDSPEGAFTARALIATRKLGDLVLLRIDHISAVATAPAEELCHLSAAV